MNKPPDFKEQKVSKVKVGASIGCSANGLEPFVGITVGYVLWGR